MGPRVGGPGGKDQDWTFMPQTISEDPLIPPAPHNLEEGCGAVPEGPPLALPVWAAAQLAARWRALSSWLCCPYWAALLAVVLVKLLLVLALAGWPVVYRAAQNTWRHMYYSYDPMLFGRNEAQFPAPRCCTGAACAAPHTGRAAVLTYLRSPEYFPLLQQLECTLRKSNPGVELVVMTVPGELPEGGEAVQWLRGLNITHLEVPPLNFPNHFAPRYGHNWLKLRALTLTQYDAVLLIDSDVVVVGDVTPLFSLPTDFAAVWDQSRLLGRYNTKLRGGINGGVLLMRPCPAVKEHMLGLLKSHPKLQFSYGAAEQDFFTWYYRFSGWMLPLEYNTMASDSLFGDHTIGGAKPVIVHFTQQKPFGGRKPGRPGHQFLCSKEELQ